MATDLSSPLFTRMVLDLLRDNSVPACGLSSVVCICPYQCDDFRYFDFLIEMIVSHRPEGPHQQKTANVLGNVC